MLFLVCFATIVTIKELDVVMDFDDIVHMDIPNMLDSVGVGEQVQVDFHDNGFVIPKESQAIIKVIEIGIQDNPIVGIDSKTIGPRLFTIGSGVQSSPNTIGITIYTSPNVDSGNRRLLT